MVYRYSLTGWVEDFNHGAIIPPSRSAIIIGINLVEEPNSAPNLYLERRFSAKIV